jgi:hypothetical protein
VEHRKVCRQTVVMDMGKLFGLTPIDIDYFEQPLVEIVRVVLHNRDVTDLVTYEGLSYLKYFLSKGLNNA